MTLTPTLENVRALVLEFANERGFDKTFCPSEVARHLSDTGWRDLMDLVREAAQQEVEVGTVVFTQQGQVVDLHKSREPVRIRKTIKQFYNYRSIIAL
jgi:hypothetical protein